MKLNNNAKNQAWIIDVICNKLKKDINYILNTSREICGSDIRAFSRDVDEIEKCIHILEIELRDDRLSH